MAAIRILEPSGSDGSIQIQKGGDFDHSQDLFFDVVNSRLGIGTRVPSSSLHVLGNITVEGSINATEYHTTVVSSSIIYQSGSTKFGDTADDTHNFTGAAIFDTAISGSHTTLADGTPFLIPGVGTNIVTASNGQITIESTFSTPDGDDGAIQFQKNNTLTGSNELFFDAGSTRLGIGTSVPSASLHVAGDVVIDGKVTATEFHSTVVSSSIIYQSGSTLFGDSTDDIHEFNGKSLFNNGLSGSLTKLVDGTSYLIAGDGVTISSSSIGSITIASPKTIGSPEDDSYDDGLFSDFTNNTPTGTAIDRFNEILKSLAPSPAERASRTDIDNVGSSCRLSFDQNNTISSYTNVGTTTSFASTEINNTFESSTAGLNKRKGSFNSTTSLTGDVNYAVAADIHSSGQVNYPAKSFGKANAGLLKIVLNDITVHSIDLSDISIGTGTPGSGSDSDLNANGTGFTNISAIDTGTFADGSELSLFVHRTASYIVAPADQNNGWNVLKIVHTIDGVDSETNTIEWLTDSDVTPLVSLNAALTSVSLSGTKYLSGISHYTGGTANYSVEVQNAYKNTYTTDNWVTFTTPNCSAPSFAFPQINTILGEDNTKLLTVNTTLTIDASTLISGTVGISVNVPHPTKSNLVNGSPLEITGILLNNKAETSTTLSENFTGESYRMKSGEYTLQSHVTNALNDWDSAESLHSNDGMMIFNEKLRSPSNDGIGASGDFTSMTNAPAMNVDYSSITTGTRTYYRKVKNTSGGSQSDLSLVVNGTGTIMQHGSTYGTTGISVAAKIPTTANSQSTGWLDLSQPFATGQYTTGSGCLQGALDTSLNATNTVTFGTKFLNNNEYIMIKIECDATFTGNVSSITVSWD